MIINMKIYRYTLKKSIKNHTYSTEIHKFPHYYLQSMQKNCFCLPLFVCEEVCVYVHQCVREYIVLVTYLMTQAINLTDDSFMQQKILKDII